MDLDRQSLSSVDKNASERGHSQFSNPMDESWKGGPYTSKENMQVDYMNFYSYSKSLSVVF